MPMKLNVVFTLKFNLFFELVNTVVRNINNIAHQIFESWCQRGIIGLSPLKIQKKTKIVLICKPTK